MEAPAQQAVARPASLQAACAHPWFPALFFLKDPIMALRALKLFIPVEIPPLAIYRNHASKATCEGPRHSILCNDRIAGNPLNGHLGNGSLAFDTSIEILCSLIIRNT